MFHRSLIAAICCLALFRQTLCTSCVEGSECEYLETPLVPEDATEWGTTLAEDIAMLETPQSGTWRWRSNFEALEFDNPDTAFPAVATFEHDPATLRFREHVAGGEGALCDPQMVQVDGTLTIRNAQGEVIISIPVTVYRDTNGPSRYAITVQITPPSAFSSEIHVLMEFEQMLVLVFVQWFEYGLGAEFGYFSQSMASPTTGFGASREIAVFEPDPP